jgi:dihydrofolate reductase
MIKKNIIVAYDDNNAIGKDNKMPWHISEDLRYFKNVTSGHPVIMGRNTYESIGKPLPNRTNIVLSHKYYDGVITVDTLAAAFDEAEKVDNECFIIGGAQLYEECIKVADELYVTHIYTSIENPDTYFPKVNPEQWYILSASDIKKDPDSGLCYQFVIYKRKKYVS